MAEAIFRGDLPCRLAAAGVAFALLGCATPPAPAPAPVLVVQAAPVTAPPPSSSPPVQPAQDAGSAASAAASATLLAIADRLRAMSPAELAQEIARLNGASTPSTQMHLAMAMMQTRIPADTQRALQIFQRVLGQDSTDARALHSLARLLVAQATEQRRLEEHAERQALLLRDAQRRVEQLNDRLEALRAIERARPSRAAN
jgi:hypothetical protein